MVLSNDDILSVVKILVDPTRVAQVDDIDPPGQLRCAGRRAGRELHVSGLKDVSKRP